MWGEPGQRGRTRRPLALALCAREAVPRCLARPGPMNVALKIVRFSAYPRLPEDTIFPAAAHTPIEWWSTAIGRALPVLHQRYQTCRACSRNRNFNDGRGLASSRTSCPDVCDENVAWAPTNNIADAGYCSPAVARRGGWPAKYLWRPTDSWEHCGGSGSARADARYCSRPCNRRTYACRRSEQQPAVK
jgi:hypothetical protein